jgi:Na+-translocating ferredoxin:NAD+ oxidoreductase RnfG subunit
MRRWVTCSSVFLLVASSGWAQERLTQEEALRLAFPAPATIERRTAYLDDRQVAGARNLAGPDVEIGQRIVTYYVGMDREIPLGVAYFDGHIVRTKSEVAMVVIDRQGRVRQVEVLRFEEPPEYRASERWMDQLKGKSLSPALSLKGDVMNLTGASLTSRALVRATRRMLAMHQVINPFGLAR